MIVIDTNNPACRTVLISSRHPEELRPLAQTLGPKTRVGTPREAALFGDVVLVSVPYGALPQIGRDLKAELAGKIVLDTGNPYPQRDGDMAIEARRVGTGVASPRYLSRAQEFDVGTPVYTRLMTAPQLRQALGLK